MQSKSTRGLYKLKKNSPDLGLVVRGRREQHRHQIPGAARSVALDRCRREAGAAYRAPHHFNGRRRATKPRGGGAFIPAGFAARQRCFRARARRGTGSDAREVKPPPLPRRKPRRARRRPARKLVLLVSLVLAWLVVLLLRAAPPLAGFAGDNQTGGRRDSRMSVIARLDGRARRRTLRLPSVDSIVDAKGGYDGGRHGQMVCQAGKANARPRELVLLDSLLSGFTLDICHSSKCGVILPR